jgi:hypothetical protein
MDKHRKHVAVAPPAVIWGGDADDISAMDTALWRETGWCRSSHAPCGCDHRVNEPHEEGCPAIDPDEYEDDMAANVEGRTSERNKRRVPREHSRR